MPSSEVATAELPKLGVDQHCCSVDDLASQAIGPKRHGVAVSAVNQ